MAKTDQASLERVEIEEVVEDGAAIEELYNDMHFVMDAEHEKIAAEYGKASRRIRKRIPDEEGKVYKIGEIGEVRVLKKNKSATKASPKGIRLEKSIQRIK